MSYQRGLFIEGRRLISIRWFYFSSEMQRWGHTCDCCGISCTPEGLKDVEHGGLWRFKVWDSDRERLTVQHRKFKWLSKSRPKLIRCLGDQKWTWCERTGRDDDGWWESMVERYAP
jgi:hypothetical protein